MESKLLKKLDVGYSEKGDNIASCKLKINKENNTFLSCLLNNKQC